MRQVGSIFWLIHACPCISADALVPGYADTLVLLAGGAREEQPTTGMADGDSALDMLLRVSVHHSCGSRQLAALMRPGETIISDSCTDLSVLCCQPPVPFRDIPKDAAAMKRRAEDLRTGKVVEGRLWCHGSASVEYASLLKACGEPAKVLPDKVRADQCCRP